jgi:hypothetical protein
MNYRNRFWQHFESDTVWENYFKGYPALMLDHCYNKEGYNLLHKAAMGGNYKFVKFLINRGMDIKTLTKTNQTIFYLCLQKFPFRIFTGHISQMHSFGVPPEFLEEIPKYTLENDTGRMCKINSNISNSINYGLVLQILINEIDKQCDKQKRCDFLSFDSFCSVGKRKLSIVHVAAAKGYIELLKQIYTWHGEKALQCTSLHTITPFHLALLYNQIPVIKWMADLKIPKFVPQKSVRLPLMMGYVTNFSYKPFYHWSCRLLYGNIHTNLFLVNMNRCVDIVRKANNTCVLYTEEQLNINYLNFKSTLNSINGKQIIRYMWITECKSRFNSICSKQIRALSEAMKTRKKHLEFLYALYIQILHFGLCDRNIIHKLMWYDIEKRHSMRMEHFPFGPTYITSGMEYLNDIKMSSDEYPFWIKNKIGDILTLNSEQNMCSRFQPQFETKTQTIIADNIQEIFCYKNEKCVTRRNFEQYLNQSQICVMSKHSMLLKRSYSHENEIRIIFNVTTTDNISEHCISTRENRQGVCFTTNRRSFKLVIPFSPKYNILLSSTENNIPELIPDF